MTVYDLRIAVFSWSSDKFSATSPMNNQLLRQATLILWERDGLYGLIPPAVVKNAVAEADDIAQAPTTVTRTGAAIIHWRQTIDMAALTVGALLTGAREVSQFPPLPPSHSRSPGQSTRT